MILFLGRITRLWQRIKDRIQPDSTESQPPYPLADWGELPEEQRPQWYRDRFPEVKDQTPAHTHAAS